MAAPIVTVLNLKGGVGKTITCYNLAAVAHERGLRTLLLDTDAQGNLTSSFLGADDAEPGIERILHPGSERHLEPLIRRTPFGYIDLVPGSPAVYGLDSSSQDEWEAAELHWCLRDALDPLRSQYDFILIDCPPRLSLVSFAALCASQGVIVPMEVAEYGALGIQQVTAAIHYVASHYNGDLRLLGYLVSKLKKSRLYQQRYLHQLRKHHGLLTFDTVIPDLAAYERAVTDRLPITLHDPKSRAAQLARDLFDEVLARLTAGTPDHGGPSGGAAVSGRNSLAVPTPR